MGTSPSIDDEFQVNKQTFELEARYIDKDTESQIERNGPVGMRKLRKPAGFVNSIAIGKSNIVLAKERTTVINHCGANIITRRARNRDGLV